SAPFGNALAAVIRLDRNGLVARRPLEDRLDPLLARRELNRPSQPGPLPAQQSNERLQGPDRLVRQPGDVDRANGVLCRVFHVLQDSSIPARGHAKKLTREPRVATPAPAAPPSHTPAGSPPSRCAASSTAAAASTPPCAV